MTEALGQSQVLSYLRRMSSDQLRFLILSFEKPQDFEKGKKEVEQLIAGTNIIWKPLPYTKNPPVLSGYWDIEKGKKLALQLCRQYEPQIVHCRGYLSSLIGNYLQRKKGLKFIFDMRGWWPDEKRESGHWQSKIYTPVYRHFKNVERRLFQQADYIVSLTEAGKSEVVRQGAAPAEKVGVIPTCVDFDLFQPFDEQKRQQVRAALKIPEQAKVLLYSGSLGGNYDINVVLKIYEAFQKRFPESYLLLLTKSRLSEADAAKIQADPHIRLASAPFREVSAYLMAGDAGLIIYKSGFSVIGRSPTKLGEYWASGLPVISLQGIGDLDLLYARYPGGGVLLSSDLSDADQKLAQFSFTEKERLRSNAMDYYHIERGARFYMGLYQQLFRTVNHEVIA